jgi:5-hydroxyisourate hydrolase-like protein (transthyretin family)
MMRKILIGLIATGMLIVAGGRHAITSQLQSHQEAAHTPGTITGYVLDAEGKPVVRAEVFAENVNAPMGKLRVVYTDNEGRFSIENLASGAYVVQVAKEEDGYPPTHSAFHFGGSSMAPQVFVYENQVTPEVLIRLGPKAAVSGQITDVKTGKPIKNARLTLRRADDSDNSYSTGLNESGQFEVLVPSGPFTITVSAPGYRTWKYKTSRLSVQANSLQLLSGDRKELKISLDPVE